MKRSRSQFEHDNRSSTGVPSNVLGKKDHEHDDARKVRNKSLYIRLQDTAVGRLFEGGSALSSGSNDRDTTAGQGPQRKDEPKVAPVPKRVVRVIAEDDYGDDEDEEDESPEGPTSPLRARNAPTFKFDAPTTPSRGTSLSRITTAASSQDQAKSSEDARKQLEEEKKAGEEAAKNSFQTRFFTLESDRDAMLEQQKLDELDRQVEAEAAGEEAAAGKEDGEVAGPKQGTLSSTNLGASSLTLKHLIGRIDAKRVAVQASDQQLRSLMSEVRKNRSKWANEERVGQEELYESAERVLAELKARTEWSAPFLQKVNRREAPDYYNIIKTPMDLGTMLKKLKSLGYQSKKEFCRDLDLIWNNCFEYNKSPENFLRKKAEQMKKETAKLVPLIPDIVIRSRAQVEAEERRLQTEFDDAEDSDDEPLKTTRGRKAPGKSSKKGANIPRKAPPTDEAAPPAPDTKTQDILANLKHGHLKNDTDSTREGSLLGFSTPPRGDTPMILTGAASQADHSEVEMPDVSILGTTNSEELDQEDDEYKTWKQVTKRERAEVAAMRHRLFRGDKVNPDEPAVVRSKAGMRRWMRLQKTFTPESAQSLSIVDESPSGKDGAATTLQEEIDDANEGLLPDYYDSTAAVPQLEERTSWKEDLDGQVIEQREECLRVIPKGYFVSLKSQLTSKIDSNMRQMQETRKIVAKIAIVKQMQVQTQVRKDVTETAEVY
jgi:transcriptional activator SPT7